MVVTEERLVRAELIAIAVHMAAEIRRIQEETGGLTSVPIPSLPAQRAFILLVEELGLTPQQAADCTLLGHCSRNDEEHRIAVLNTVFGESEVWDGDPREGEL